MSVSFVAGCWGYDDESVCYLVSVDDWRCWVPERISSGPEDELLAFLAGERLQGGGWYDPN